MLGSFLEEATKNFYENYLLDMEKKHCDYIVEGVNVPYPQLTIDTFPFKYLDESVQRLVSLCENLDELEDFYSKVYVSTKIADVPTSIPIMNIDEVSSIKPQYLEQFVGNASSLIERSINGKMSTSTLTKLTDKEYAKNLRKQVVDSSFPNYISDSELVNHDTRVIYVADVNFITRVILPFIRTMKVKLKGFIKESGRVKETITNCLTMVNEYIGTYNRLKGSNDVNEKKTNMAIVAIIQVFFNISKYMIACFIRMTSSYSYNLQQYYKLKDNLMRYYPGGETTVLHESVLDGINDFRDEDLVHSMINGNTDFLTAVNEKLYNTFYDYLCEENRSENKETFIEDIPYDKTPYDKIVMMFKTIFTSFQTFYDELQNPDTPIQDIKEKSGLVIPFPEQFEGVINDIQSIDFYTSYEDATKKDVYSSILNELKETNTAITNYGKIAKNIFVHLKNIEDSIKENINNQYENIERNAETIELIHDVEKNYRDFLLTVSRAVLNRYNQLEDELTNTDIKDEVNEIFNSDANDYNEVSEACRIELMNTLHKLEMDSLYKEFVERKDTKSFKGKIFYEATPPAQPAGTPAAQPTTGTLPDASSTKPADPKAASATKVTVTDDNTETGSTSSGGGKTVNQDFIQKIIEKVKNFNKTIIDKILKVMETNKANVDWLKNNKDGLIKRSYTNVSVNILPYDESSDPLGKLDTVVGVVHGLTKKVVLQTKPADIEKLMFGSLNLQSVQMENKEAAIGERLTQLLKIGKNKLQTLPVKDSELGSKIPKMIEYCENYYGSFATQLQSKSKEVEAAMELFTKNMLAPDDGTPVAEGGSLQSNVTTISSNMTTLVGAAINAAKDRANDYMTVLNALAPKAAPKEQSQQQQA